MRYFLNFLLKITDKDSILIHIKFKNIVIVENKKE